MAPEVGLDHLPARHTVPSLPRWLQGLQAVLQTRGWHQPKAVHSARVGPLAFEVLGEIGVLVGVAVVQGGVHVVIGSTYVATVFDEEACGSLVPILTRHVQQRVTLHVGYIGLGEA